MDHDVATHGSSPQPGSQGCFGGAGAEEACSGGNVKELSACFTHARIRQFPGRERGRKETLPSEVANIACAPNQFFKSVM
jgi:hypothetical protein